MVMYEEAVSVPTDGVRLAGDLKIPESARAVVLFAHGSGSSRFSPRNRGVAAYLEESGLATLLMDLLTEEEAEIDAVTTQHRFDIALLGRRVVSAVDWLGAYPATEAFAPHLFGASTGAAAALVAAAERPERIRTVVSRGGRPDLAGDAVGQVRAPVLLVVGGRDTTVLEMNERAADRMTTYCRTQVIPGASHLFAEPGALRQVAEAARNWFLAEGDPEHPADWGKPGKSAAPGDLPEPPGPPEPEGPGGPGGREGRR